jgi:hypothetical protein
MVLSHAYGLPSPPEVFSFFLGAVLAFGGVTVEFGVEPSHIQLWGSFRFLSVGVAVAVAWLASAYVPGFPGWPLGGFVATASFLVMVGAENSAANMGAGQ